MKVDDYGILKQYSTSIDFRKSHDQRSSVKLVQNLSSFNPVFFDILSKLAVVVLHQRILNVKLFLQ